MATRYRDDADMVEVLELSEEEQRQMLDREARQLLGVGGKEFIRRWYAGDYRDSDDPNVTSVAILLPDVW